MLQTQQSTENGSYATNLIIKCWSPNIMRSNNCDLNFVKGAKIKLLGGQFGVYKNTHYY